MISRDEFKKTVQEKGLFETVKSYFVLGLEKNLEGLISNKEIAKVGRIAHLKSSNLESDESSIVTWAEKRLYEIDNYNDIFSVLLSLDVDGRIFPWQIVFKRSLQLSSNLEEFTYVAMRATSHDMVLVRSYFEEKNVSFLSDSDNLEELEALKRFADNLVREFPLFQFEENRYEAGINEKIAELKND